MSTIKILNFFLVFVCFNAHANYIGGLGYIDREDYRVENEINPSPLGTNFLPMLAYRGERLSVFGPKINYALIKGAFGLGLTLSPSGDRYKARDLDQRDGAINAGVSLRLLFLSLSYSADITHVHKGQTAKASLGWRFALSKQLLFAPRISKEFLSKSFVNYYYGIAADEVGEFSFYEAQGAVNNVYGAALTYISNPKHSFTLNYSKKHFDRVIYESPTIDKKSYATTSFFWNYNF